MQLLLEQRCVLLKDVVMIATKELFSLQMNFNRFSFCLKACGFQILCRRNGTKEVDLKVSE